MTIVWFLIKKCSRYSTPDLAKNKSPPLGKVTATQLRPNWWVGKRACTVWHVLSVQYMPYLLPSESFPVGAQYSGISRVRGCLESGGWETGTKTKEKRWMVWVVRWKRAWQMIHYLQSLLSGGCHWPYKFMIWKTGKRRHAVMDGMMVNKAVQIYPLSAASTATHTYVYIWHESRVHLWTPSLVKYSLGRASTQKLRVLFPAHKKPIRLQEEATSTWRDLISQPPETEHHNCHCTLAKAEN